MWLLVLSSNGPLRFRASSLAIPSSQVRPPLRIRNLIFLCLASKVEWGDHSEGSADVVENYLILRTTISEDGFARASVRFEDFQDKTEFWLEIFGRCKEHFLLYMGGWKSRMPKSLGEVLDRPDFQGIARDLIGETYAGKSHIGEVPQSVHCVINQGSVSAKIDGCSQPMRWKLNNEMVFGLVCYGWSNGMRMRLL